LQLSWFSTLLLHATVFSLESHSKSDLSPLDKVPGDGDAGTHASCVWQDLSNALQQLVSSLAAAANGCDRIRVQLTLLELQAEAAAQRQWEGRGGLPVV